MKITNPNEAIEALRPLLQVDAGRVDHERVLGVLSMCVLGDDERMNTLSKDSVFRDWLDSHEAAMYFSDYNDDSIYHIVEHEFRHHFMGSGIEHVTFDHDAPDLWRLCVTFSSLHGSGSSFLQVTRYSDEGELDVVLEQ